MPLLMVQDDPVLAGAVSRSLRACGYAVQSLPRCNAGPV
jgi:DNA-binding response OmpR family regulator